MSEVKKVLLVPLVKKGEGTGHLRRMLSLSAALPGARILVDAESGKLVSRIAALPDSRTVTADEALRVDWDFVVFDHRRTPPELLDMFALKRNAVGLDEGGPARQAFAFLLDTLPFPDRGNLPNVSDPGFLDLPQNRRLPPEEFRSVLLTFGGEDPAGLSGPCVRAVLSTGAFPPEAVTVVRGPLCAAPDLPPGVRVLDSPPDLKERLASFDLVITSFGLTAYEAAFAGVPVILCNPTPYHALLSRRAGFLTAGTGKPDPRKLGKYLSSPEMLSRSVERFRFERREPLPELLGAMDFSSGTGCPSCGTRAHRAVFRQVSRSFFRCRTCGLLYQKDYAGERVSYGKEYFFEEYRAQYGKTYLEDFSAIKHSGSSRVRIIGELLSDLPEPAEGKSILDIGCAYGPFLDAARDSGFSPFGIDISADAAAYVRETLGIPARAAAFPGFSPGAAFGRKMFSAVSMWFVIEHFPDLTRVLEAVNGLLPVGGVFAFSTPNTGGISGKKDISAFLSRSPRDHFTLWEPGRTRSLLARYGFRVRRIRVTGHHPERFPLLGRPAAGHTAPARLLYRLLAGASVLFGLGDTFETYAVKVGNYNHELQEQT